MVQIFLLFSEWALLILRVALGFALIGHGRPKLRDLRATAAMFVGMGFHPGMLWGTIAALVETFGGLFLIVGFFTQIVALIAAAELLVVLGWHLKRRDKLVGGYETALLILAGALTIAANGSVLFSLDGYFGILF